MALKSNQDPGWYDSRDKGAFADRYPDLPLWLDGDIWELDIENDLLESLASFRANLWYYVNRQSDRDKRVRTRVIKREDRQYLAIQAVNRRS
jgi:hypothetical protein